MFALVADAPATDGSCCLALAGAIQDGCVSLVSLDGSHHDPSQQAAKNGPDRSIVHYFTKDYANFVVDSFAAGSLKDSSTYR
jgi:hypothetical protein